MTSKSVLIGVFGLLVTQAMAQNYDVAAYVWPAYHPAVRWAELGIFKDGKGEWQNLYESVKRFSDDNQCAKPLWGYTDESDPVQVAQKIDAAVSAGVNVFIYDWYWYCGRPFLEEALDNGFLCAQNNERMRFYVMWANHDVNGLWNNKLGEKEKKPIIWSAKVSDEDFRQMTARWIGYFKRPNYYKIGDRPVLMLYDTEMFIKWDGIDKARERIAYLRSETKRAGFPDLHFQILVQWWWDQMPELFAQVKTLGVDSMTIYNWGYRTMARVNDEKLPPLSYREWGEMSVRNLDLAKRTADELGVPYFPHLSVGWDTNARYPHGEKKGIVHGSNPKDFERFAREVRSWADRNVPAGMPKLITVNSWNEWTEGTYLEPDDRFGYGYLNALWQVFRNDK